MAAHLHDSSSSGVQVRPLRRQLKGLKAWITGQRKDQSPGTRQAVPVVQVRTCGVHMTWQRGAAAAASCAGRAHTCGRCLT